MNQKPPGRASSSEPIIRDIKRKTRKQYGAEEKIRIVLDGLRGEDSIAEIDWSEAGDVLEVSLRGVLPEDLEIALTWSAGRKFVLDQRPETKVLVQNYLRDHFQLRTTDNRVLPLRLVGMEIAYDETWLYLTVQARPDMLLRLRNTILMDVDSTQTNRVQLLWATPDATLILTSANPEKAPW